MSCEHCGPGYATPQEAFQKGPREQLLYVPAIVADKSHPDYLATVDCNPTSPTFSSVIHRLPLAIGDEPHHTGWNACSSCHSDSSRSRSHLVLPTLGSGRIYAVDTKTNPRAPQVSHVIQPEEIATKTGLSYLHTSHCLGDGNIMVSAMGTPAALGGDAKGNFILISPEYKVLGTWTGDDDDGTSDGTEFGYDFWYQPRLGVMVSTGWGAPNAFSKGFDPGDVAAGKYNSAIWFWDWNNRKLMQTVDLGEEGMIPLEVRFLHEPSAPHGYVGCALSSNVVHFTIDSEKKKKNGTQQGEGKWTDWTTNVAIKQPHLTVQNWVLPTLPPLITDILISMDDNYLFFSNWLRGDVCMYSLKDDPAHPTFVARIWLGGIVAQQQKGSSGNVVTVVDGLPDGVNEIPPAPIVKGKQLQGGPQMLQLSLDGKRLYVTNSSYSPWDGQFYPEMVKKGGYLIQVDVDTVKGELTLNEDFYVDFGEEPNGPALVHEVRYPGGDCSSDIWV